MDREAWGSTVHKVAESTTLKQLSMHAQLAHTADLPLCAGQCSWHCISVLQSMQVGSVLYKTACWLCELPKLLVHPEEENDIPHDICKKESKTSQNKY